eukprot:7361613-Ditylum_brightwellii.AAC.1
MDMLGPGPQDIRSTFKVFNSLIDARGCENFGAIHYQMIIILVMYAKDKKRQGQVVNAADFNEIAMLKHIKESQVKSSTDSKELEVLDHPKLQDGNFHKWKQVINSILLTKKGSKGVQLAYVLIKNTVPTTFANDQEQLIHEAQRSGSGWEEDSKEVGTYLVSLLSGTHVDTWTKKHHKSQDGRGVLTTLHIHYLGESQKGAIVKKARKTKNGAFYRSQGSYTFAWFSTNIE